MGKANSSAPRLDRSRPRTSQGAAEATVGGAASSADNYRSLEPPGTFWEYNDVRVNRTALSLLRLFRGPLPPVLKERIMDPIGASSTWEWHGYETSWVEESGQRVQSVSGGTHWGGGLWITSYDHARFGLLFQRRGRWNDRQLLSAQWIDHALTPCPIKPEYGFLWVAQPPARHVRFGLPRQLCRARGRRQHRLRRAGARASHRPCAGAAMPNP